METKPQVVRNTVKPKGEMIRRLRRQLGLTAKQLALRADIGLRTLERIEAESKPIQLTTIRNIAAELKVIPGTLFTDDSPQPHLDAPLQTVNLPDAFNCDPEESNLPQQIIEQYSETIFAQGITYIYDAYLRSLHICIWYQDAYDHILGINALAEGKLVPLGIESLTIHNPIPNGKITCEDEMPLYLEYAEPATDDVFDQEYARDRFRQGYTDFDYFKGFDPSDLIRRISGKGYDWEFASKFLKFRYYPILLQIEFSYRLLSVIKDHISSHRLEVTFHEDGDLLLKPLAAVPTPVREELLPV